MTIDPFDQSLSPEQFRIALADYLVANLEAIRASAGRKLTVTTRAVHDSEDVAASVVRRVDQVVARGRIRPGSPEELWAFVHAVARNTAITRVRVAEAARTYLAGDGPACEAVARRLVSRESDDEATMVLCRMVASLGDSIDRQVLALRLRGATHAVIGRTLGLTEAASRMRWARLCEELRERFSEDQTDELQGPVGEPPR